MSISVNGQTETTPRAAQDAVGLRLIIGYKFAKASAECLLAGLLLLLGTTHLTEELRAAALGMQRHATEAWSLALAGRLVDAATARTVLLVALAAFLDAVLSCVEGWALHRRYRWSGWLVVGTTVSLLPFEAVELVRRLSWGRVALLVVNALIVVYLVRHRGDARPTVRP